MTHSVHPYSHRLGIIRDWKSRWFGKNGQYQEMLRGDITIREFLQKRLRGFYIETVEIERSQDSIRVIIKTARPGMLIGKSGEGVAKLKQEILKQFTRHKILLPKELKLDIEEVKDPDSRSAIVAQMVAEGLEKRLPFRRVLKSTIEKVMGNKNVLGIKITLSGRLGGADMGRTESLKDGQIPLQTLRADIDFAREKANLSYGVIGVKVWIYRGEIFDESAK
ncbi:MAG: 30S ribosomal protein S3 [Candidatus Vogelbacteria bacterium]|jgi:small subunit ribosomal protein S3|nr:30S ribosomal protein S3 [Candidatus Vogelbacteria bacterium]